MIEKPYVHYYRVLDFRLLVSDTARKFNRFFLFASCYRFCSNDKKERTM